ncbi:hypothetical protein RRG08_055577 [Elysia crispata]|uniref:Uncharacterized protein n=1 Tax=Elysia crispata TaxID=231223 RepID=A0AAE1B073_9GAST|nr:hypothetical protein RRG08_055577 [Elysia crispata]
MFVTPHRARLRHGGHTLAPRLQPLPGHKLSASHNVLSLPCRYRCIRSHYNFRKFLLSYLSGSVQDSKICAEFEYTDRTGGMWGFCRWSNERILMFVSQKFTGLNTVSAWTVANCVQL